MASTIETSEPAGNARQISMDHVSA